MLRLCRQFLQTVVLGLLCVSGEVRAFSSGITTSSFGSQGCNQSGCHSGGSPPVVTLSGPVSVLPSASGTFTLQITETGSQNYAGLNVSGALGTLTLGGPDSANTQLLSGSFGNNEVTHTSPKMASGGLVTFSFLWTAPASFTTAILNAWGNAVNLNGNVAGDRAAFAQKIVFNANLASCAAIPQGVCRAPTLPEASVLVLGDSSDDTLDRLVWRWLKGAETQQAAFGDPLSSTSYALCVYDAANNLISADSIAPGGMCGTVPCWKDLYGTGYKYLNKSLSPDGKLTLLMKSGLAGAAKVKYRWKGTHVLMPSLPIALPVTVQLVNSDGECWGATFSTSVLNEPGRFKAKSD